MTLTSCLFILFAAAAFTGTSASLLLGHPHDTGFFDQAGFRASSARNPKVSASVSCLYNVTAAKDLDLPKFAGIWYIVAITTQVDDKRWKCAKLNFTHLIHYPNLDHFNVTYHSVYNGKSRRIPGYLVHNNKTLDGDMVGYYDDDDKRRPIDFRIVLTVRTVDQIRVPQISHTSNYPISFRGLSQDYDNYAMSYFCDSNNPTNPSEQVLFLSRRQAGLKTYRYHALKNDLKRFGWDQNTLDRLKNSGC